MCTNFLVQYCVMSISGIEFGMKLRVHTGEWSLPSSGCKFSHGERVHYVFGKYNFSRRLLAVNVSDC